MRNENKKTKTEIIHPVEAAISPDVFIEVSKLAKKRVLDDEKNETKSKMEDLDKKLLNC